MPNRKRGSDRRTPHFTFEQLRTFAAVAAREHVTGAAAALGISQSAVSEQVRLLEGALGLHLVERAGRGIRVTEAGRAVQRLAVAVLDGVVAIEALGADYEDGRRGAVTVGCGHVLGTHRLAAWLRRFVEENPLIDVDIVLDGWTTLVERLQAGTVDIAIMSIDAAPAGLETIVLEQTEVVIVVGPSHPLAADGEAAADRLGAYRQLVHGRGSGTESLARQILAAGASSAARMELEEGALLAALRAGLGWAAMPRSVVDAEVAAGGLVVLAHRGGAVVQRFCAVRRRGPSPAAVESLWKHLEDIAGAAATVAAMAVGP
jgi:DNA-binding transcriptional LysR family regulator